MTCIEGLNCAETKFSIKDFFSKCDQIRSFLRIWSHLLKKPLMENFTFLCSVSIKLLQQNQSKRLSIVVTRSDMVSKVCSHKYMDWCYLHNLKNLICIDLCKGQLYLYQIMDLTLSLEGHQI